MAGEGTGVEGVAVDVAGALADFQPAEAPPGEDEGKTEGAEGKAEGAEGEASPKEGEEGAPDARDAEIATLKGKIEELTKAVSSIQKPSEAPPEAGKPTKYFEKPDDFEKTFETQEQFEALLEKVSSNTANRANRDLLKQLPSVVANLVNTQVNLVRGIDKFYGDNKDLTDKKQFVAHVANDLMGKNPGWNLNKLFTELGKEVRTRLGTKPNVGTGKSGPGIPPRRTGSRIPATKLPQLEGVQGEIVELLEDQGGIKR